MRAFRLDYRKIKEYRNLSLTLKSLAPKSAVSHSIKRKAVTTWCNSVPKSTPPHYRVICRKKLHVVCANRPANKNEKKYKININATALLPMLQVFLLFIPLSLWQQLEYIKVKLIQSNKFSCLLICNFFKVNKHA